MHDKHPDSPHRSHPHASDSNGLTSPRLDHDSKEDVFEFDPNDPRMVLVVWKDAESQGGPTWEDTEEMLEFARRPLNPVTTVGLLLHVDEEQIAVTDTVAMDQMGGVTKIPRAWVVRFEALTPTGSLPTANDLADRGEEPSHPRRVG